MSTPSDSQRPPSQSYGAASSPQRIRPVADMEKIVSLCKRRGFIFQSSEIYGGLNGAWDYGPLGVELKRNLKNYWWRVIVHERDDVVGMDGSVLMNRAVWKASGHEHTFTDLFVECPITKKRFRADQVEPQSGVAYYYSGATGRMNDDDAERVLQTEVDHILRDLEFVWAEPFKDYVRKIRR